MKTKILDDTRGCSSDPTSQRLLGPALFGKRVRDALDRRGIHWLLLSASLVCGCDRGPTAPRAPPIGGPSVRAPLPQDPALQRLIEMGAQVLEGQIPPGLSSYTVLYEGKNVDAEMLAPMPRVPKSVGVTFNNCTVLRGALAELDGMPLLDVLRLRETRLSDKTLAELTSLPGLQVLEVNKADGITGRGLGFLTSCTKLSLVQLMDSPIEDDALIALADHPRLTHLDLSGTRVGDDGLRKLTNLPTLKWLSLDKTPITGLGLASLAQLTDLKVLSLNGTRITDQGLPAFAQLAALRSLDMKDTKITDAGLIHLLGCTKLAVLALDGTKVTDEGMSQLARLPALLVLELNDTVVTDAGMAKLAGSTTLRSVEARSTQVTKAARKLLPKVETLHFNGSHDSSNNPVP